ncbi:phospholipase D family protein [Thermomonas sp. HDW16]|uniref:phospholipase D family protein n=1 Tax=Thermomonas sp. HDW16 TaxID=2714945 RepID=UPI00140C20C3|nr:phospholipase D family protein [Thermomonas sp. HDW16]QIL19402.1 phospholipase D family protein [Thermomonas sp. HDW16]
MKFVRGRVLLALAALLLGGCASISPQQREAAAGVAITARSTQIDCNQANACALASPLHEMGERAFAESTPTSPKHYARIVDGGPDALLARIHMIRAARRNIDLQTYIFDEDDSAHLVLDELQAAAFRGVKVRVLLDQLSALEKVSTLAAFAAVHANFELRVYNPVLDRARLSTPMYTVAAACCWDKLNRRMHNKLLLVDGMLGITGGRNYQDDYYDWDAAYNFRDRDLLIAGPVARDMGANFDAFWRSPLSVPAERLGDVARFLLAQGAPPLPHEPYRKPERVQALLAQVVDGPLIRNRFVEPALSVQGVHFIGDLPDKHVEAADGTAKAGSVLQQLIASARHEVLLQTPYLVLSKPAQHVFRSLHKQPEPPRVLISTNSLASTDAFIAYAISRKYKRRYMRDFGFEIHEFKPFPANVPFDPGPLGADLQAPVDEVLAAPRRQTMRERRLSQRRLSEAPGSEASRNSPFSSGGMPVRLQRAGMRMGLHAKSMVVDERVGVVGTHNFDPRGDTLNTESAVVIADPAFARQLAASIRGDMAPDNAWTIGRRDSSPILPGVEFTLARVSERMPIFDLWPIKYATSYQFVPGPDCPRPLSPFDADFRRCYQPVGEFPEVDLGLKWLGVRLFTAFGAGLSPIL